MGNGRSGCRACTVVSSFFLGGLIGAAVATLVAPKAGEETRRQIRRLAEDARGKAVDYYEEVKETVASALKDGKGLIDEKKRLIADAVKAGIEAYEKKA